MIHLKDSDQTYVLRDGYFYPVSGSQARHWKSKESSIWVLRITQSVPRPLQILTRKSIRVSLDH